MTEEEEKYMIHDSVRQQRKIYVPLYKLAETWKKNGVGWFSNQDISCTLCQPNITPPFKHLGPSFLIIKRKKKRKYKKAWSGLLLNSYGCQNCNTSQTPPLI